MYILYCSILDHRISYWCEANGKIVDEQNGFHKNRSTKDHVSTMNNFIDTKKKINFDLQCLHRFSQGLCLYN